MSTNQSNGTHSLLDSATGSIPYKMTNDYMFKEVMQRNNDVLKGLIASLLHIEMDDVKSVMITNPIKPGDAVNDKTVILDVNVLFNNSTYLDLEMQVANLYNWVDRSSYYLCRNFSNLLFMIRLAHLFVTLPMSAGVNMSAVPMMTSFLLRCLTRI